MKHNQPIGILDTGVGGLSVYNEIVKLLPHESILYLGDSAHAPYGKLTEDVIFERSKKLVAFLLANDVKLIVVACNTITVSCIAKLRETFPQVPIVGTVPVVKTAAAASKAKCFGILSTTITANSEYQKELIKKFADGHKVLNLGTDELVPLIEGGVLSGERIVSVLKKVLAPLQKEHIDTLVLGCTHYPFIKSEMQKILGPDVQILDSAPAVARQVQRVLLSNKMLGTDSKPKFYYYTTGSSTQFEAIAKKLTGVTIASTQITV